MAASAAVALLIGTSVLADADTLDGALPPSTTAPPVTSTTVTTTAPSTTTTSAPVTTTTMPPTRFAKFTTNCRFSHRGPDDPIVHPDHAGMSHMHDFFGNRSTGASSTYDSMLGAETSCDIVSDTAGYWVPALLMDGHPVNPTRVVVYYTSANKPLGSIQAFPAGLMMVVGSGSAQSPQNLKNISWDCGPQGGPRQPTPPDCPSGKLQAHLRFPDCWDGRNLDSADHISHMTYSRRRRCPASHPVSVPELRYQIGYPLTTGSLAELSSGSRFSLHADFFNTWDQVELERLVSECINLANDCSNL